MTRAQTSGRDDATEDLAETIARAFTALVAFAEKNFPALERLKYVSLLELGPGANVLVGGGVAENGKVMMPGVWHYWNDSMSSWGSGEIGESRFDDVEALLGVLNPDYTHRGAQDFVREARKIVDF